MRPATIEILNYLLQHAHRENVCAHDISLNLGITYDHVFKTVQILKKLKIITVQKTGRRNNITMINEPVTSVEALNLLIKINDERRNSLHKNLPNMRKSVSDIHGAKDSLH